MINLDTVRAHVAAIGDLLDLPLAHPGAYEGLDDAVLREHVAVHLRAALADTAPEAPTPPSAERAPGVLADFLDALRDLTDAEVKALADATNAATNPATNAARVTAWNAARYAARYAARGVAWGTVRDAAWDAAWDVAGLAARDAGRALVVADLVGQYGLTREHLDTLTGPARTIPRLATIIDRALGAR